MSATTVAPVAPAGAIVDPVVGAVVRFAPTLIAWQRVHGRQTLPWQQLGADRDAYRIWLAEVMLQQTQVAAVIPFYRRFLERFPDVRALAAAPADDVMASWAGLGYYSRARNLHAAAQRVVSAFDGTFPDDVDALRSLPGVGRSTAGAIAAFAYGRKAPILEGNVKRVFARAFLIEGSLATTAAERALWSLADALLPDGDIERYTQGLMDLGATVCTPRSPACLICPFETTCLAHRAGRETSLPERAPRKAVPQRRATLMLFVRDGKLLVERRPPTGLWGGLWSLPEIAGPATPEALDAACRVHGEPSSIEPVAGFVHGFTHFVLQADVLLVRLGPADLRASEVGATRWVTRDALAGLGLPTPIRALLAEHST